MFRRHALAALLTLPALPARAAWPDKPIRIISPYPPGGGTDVTARLLSGPLTARFSRGIVVENRAGAGGSIGAAEVARAAPDGYTLLIDALGHAVNPAMLRGLPFDYATAFTPISQLTRLPQVMIAPLSGPTTLAAFVAAARAKPGGVTYGSSGNGTGAQLAAVLFARAAGLQMEHAPYRGGSTAMQAVLAGEVAFTFATVNTAAQLVQDGQLRAYAVVGDRRLAALPNVPTLTEAGYPDCDLYEWNGLFAPAGTPKMVIDTLYAAFSNALRDPAAIQRFAQLGTETLGTSPAAFAAFVAAQRATMAALVREAGIEAG
jgi:tripartite-type tricarboxylate transporter receptor subunit TctC